jgi:hypothetical protein
MRRIFKTFFLIIPILGMMISCEKGSLQKEFDSSIESVRGNPHSGGGAVTLDTTFIYTEASTIPPCVDPFSCPLPVWTSYRTFYLPLLVGVNKPTISVFSLVSNQSSWVQLAQRTSVAGLTFYPGAGAFARSGGNINTAIGALSASNTTLTFTVHIVASWKANN